jgi:hypothetical protein
MTHIPQSLRKALILSSGDRCIRGTVDYAGYDLRYLVDKVGGFRSHSQTTIFYLRLK